MRPSRQELTYIDEGETLAEEAGRIENICFRQEPLNDFADPNRGIISRPGARRRTSYTRPAMIENGPGWVDGARTAWFIVVDENGGTTLYSVETATEMVNLPSNAMPAHEYLAQLAAEEPSLAGDLFAFLTAEARTHTAHHTTGADIGPRERAIFQREQVRGLVYQDAAIGDGIAVPPVRRRPRDPATLVGPDGVKW